MTQTLTLKTFDQADQDDVAISQLADHDRVAFWAQFNDDLAAEGIVRLGRAIEQYRKDHSEPTQTITTSLALDVWRHWNWQETLATWE